MLNIIRSHPAIFLNAVITSQKAGVDHYVIDDGIGAQRRTTVECPCAKKDAIALNMKNGVIGDSAAARRRIVLNAKTIDI